MCVKTCFFLYGGIQSSQDTSAIFTTKVSPSFAVWSESHALRENRARVLGTPNFYSLIPPPLKKNIKLWCVKLLFICSLNKRYRIRRWFLFPLLFYHLLKKYPKWLSWHRFGILNVLIDEHCACLVRKHAVIICFIKKRKKNLIIPSKILVHCLG